MKYIIQYSLIALILSACGPSYHLRMSQKHLRKAQIKGAIITPDTIWKTVPIITPEIKFETVLKPINVKDTLIVRDKESGGVTKVFIHKTDTLIRSVFIHHSNHLPV
jgi:hypothetical protein